MDTSITIMFHQIMKQMKYEVKIWREIRT